MSIAIGISREQAELLSNACEHIQNTMALTSAEKSQYKFMDEALRDLMFGYDCGELEEDVINDFSETNEELTDSKGCALERGAMYCIVDISQDDDPQYGCLVRYLGEGRFADADTWEEVRLHYDSLEMQSAPIVDPAKYGY